MGYRGRGVGGEQVNPYEKKTMEPLKPGKARDDGSIPSR